MASRSEPLAFSTCHALVPAVCFAGILAVTMCAVHPVATGISLMGALAFSVTARGSAATARGLRWQLPLLVLVCLANPFFSASGSTVLWKLGPTSVYLESLAFGANMGALMVAVVLWFEGAAAVLTQDRLLGLAGGRMRSLPLVASMASQLLPQLIGRGHAVHEVRVACTAAGPAPARREGLTRASGVVLSWALEDSLERADAMRARGWESGLPRTSFAPDRFTSADAWAVAAIVLLAGTSGALMWVACSQWRFYPTMPRLVVWWGYFPFVLLCALPLFSAILGRARARLRMDD